MNGTIFGMGLPEVLAIAILTLLVFGPDRLPGLMRNFGRSVRKMREIYATLSAEINKELGPYAREINEATRELREDINSIREVTNVGNLLPSLSLETGAAPATTTPAAEPAAHAGPLDAAGVPLAPVNDTPLAAPPTAAPEAVAAEPSPAPETEPAPAPTTGVSLSDDNPWGKA